MKQINTFICCVLFVIAGALSIGFNSGRDGPTLFPGNASMQAIPAPIILSPNAGLPLDLQLDLTKGAKKDTVYINKTDTIQKIKYKTKIQKVVVPEVVEKCDTLLVPIFYIATPLEHEVESTEIHVIDDVHINSILQTNQTDSIMHNN